MTRHSRTFRPATVIAISVMGFLLLAALPFNPFGLRPEPRSVQAYGIVNPATVEGTVYAVTVSNRLISFNSVTPGALNSNVAITGLPSGDNIIGIDFRPRTGQLFAISSTRLIYTLNLTTGAATQVGTAPLTPAFDPSDVGIDFNPLPDRIRVVSASDLNVRLNPNDGTLAGTDTPLAYATGDANASANPNIVGAAYTSNFSGATVTTLYGIDSNLDILVRQGSPGGTPNSPNGGALTTIGPLGVNTTELTGFDIFTLNTDTALASLTIGSATTSSLYSINLTTGAASLVGAIGGTEAVRDMAIVPRTETIFALTAGNNLVSFNSGTPGVIDRTLQISGLSAGENLLGIDFRPANGALYALSSASRVYVINTSTGAAAFVGSATGVAGTAFGFDFNPIPDRIRISGPVQNLRLNPNNGALAGTDTALAYATGDAGAGSTPNITGAAYSSNAAGAASTTLYVIDANRDTLVLQGSPGGTPNSPNGGQLTTVGMLGVNTTNDVGFDIASNTGAAFASLTTQGATSSMIYTINLATGAATAIGMVGGGEVIRDIAIPVRVETVYGVTTSNALVSFNSLTPGTLLSTVPITGLQAGENIAGIDFRPANGLLYALSSSNRLYVINPISGGALLIGSQISPALTGAVFGFDFNPVPDRIRVVSEADANLRLHPDTAAIAGTDTNLAYASGDANSGNPNVTAVAYTNAISGVTSTTLFGIDTGKDILVRQGSAGGAPTSPNTGALSTIGALGLDAEGSDAGMDISDCSGTGYATLRTTVNGTSASRLYSVNLLTGAVTLIGDNAQPLTDIAVATRFIPSASAQTAPIAVVNSASFADDTISPDELITIFGSFQTTNGQSVGASGFPTTLGGISVRINGMDAGLSFASNFQINALVPAGIEDGPATVTVNSSNGTTKSSVVMVTRTSPGIFTIRATGHGTAAALVTPDGISYQPVYNADGSERDISAGTATQPSFLVLYGTGLRRAPAINPTDSNGVAESVTATIQGLPATVTFAGAVGAFSGLDQVNVQIPPQLAGTGIVKVRLSVNGRPSNSVTIRLGGQPPAVTYRSIVAGQFINAALSSNDQVQLNESGQTYFFDAYRFTAAANTSVAVALNSTTFDGLVGIARINPDGSLTYVASDDQTGGLGNGDSENDNALLLTVLPEAGDYAVIATSAETSPAAVGAYSVSLLTGVIQPVSYSATAINGQFTLSDLATSAGDFLDAYSFTGTAGDVLQIAMNSTVVDSFLILNRNNGELVDFDDYNGGGQNALLSTTLTQTGTYIIIATPFAPGVTGAYMLTVNRQNVPTLAEKEALPPEGGTRILRLPEERNASPASALDARRIIPREARPQ
jgi:uncharacterized protein (TIGR03437 family)